MKKASLVCAFAIAFTVLLGSPFYVHAYIAPSQTVGTAIVATSTVGLDQGLLWLGISDGTEVIKTLTLGIYVPGPNDVRIGYRCQGTLATTTPLNQTGCIDTSINYSDWRNLQGGGPLVLSLESFSWATSTIPLQAGKAYLLFLETSGVGGLTYYGKNGFDFSGQNRINGAFGDYDFKGTPFYFFRSITSPLISVSSATSSSFWSGTTASSTLTALAGDCSTAGNIFAEGICTAFSFLFLPSNEVIDGLVGVKDVAATKVPFSYVAEVNTVFTSIATSSSNSSFPLFTIPLSGVASSSLTGAIPDLTLSTTTISIYLPDPIRVALKLLIAAVIWLTAGWYVYHAGMRLLAPRT